MGQKQLLREWYALDYKPELIKEDREKNGGKIFLKGILQRHGVKNQNKRVYPEGVLRREAENYLKAVRESRAVGELDHPESSTVSLQNVSHVIREMHWDGDALMGTVEVLSTPKGQILEKILESGITVGISSRGVGSTEQTNEGTDIVQGDYQLICFDVVSEPSTPGAYLHEGLARDLRVQYTRGDRIYRALNDIITR